MGAAIAQLLLDLIMGGVKSGLDISMGTKAWNSQRNANYFNKLSWLYSMQREDSAVQRRVADLKKAGLSPTLAAGSAASTMSPIQIKPMDKTIDFSKLAMNQQMVNNMVQNQLMNKQIENIDNNISYINQKKDIDLKMMPFQMSRIAFENARKEIETKINEYNYELAKRAGIGTKPGVLGSTMQSVMDWILKAQGWNYQEGEKNINPTDFIKLNKR